MAKKKADETAMSFLNMAREYIDAADAVFARSDGRPKVGNHRALSSPIGLLYFHALELGLKAFLRACGLPIEGTWRHSHDLPRLYKECRAKGLVVDQDDKVGLENIVNLLNSGNENQGFRYFSSGTVVTADLEWAREIIERFMTVVAREVPKRDPSAGDPPRPAKVIVTVKVT